MIEPFCEDTGLPAVKGCCPIHNGDACLVMPKGATERLTRMKGELKTTQERLIIIKEVLRELWDHKKKGTRIPAEISEQGTPACMNWARERQAEQDARIEAILNEPDPVPGMPGWVQTYDPQVFLRSIEDK